MPLLTLPSGAVAPLECPGLLPLLSGGGSTLAIARATLAHDEVDAGSLTLEDCYAVALWGIRQFAVSDDAIALTAVCQAFCEAPSRRLRVTERTLSWALDKGCFLALKEARKQASEDEEEHEHPRAGVLNYSVPDPWTGDDDG